LRMAVAVATRRAGFKVALTRLWRGDLRGVSGETAWSGGTQTKVKWSPHEPPNHQNTTPKMSKPHLQATRHVPQAL
jgi:hypothetical protein